MWYVEFMLRKKKSVTLDESACLSKEIPKSRSQFIIDEPIGIIQISKLKTFRFMTVIFLAKILSISLSNTCLLELYFLHSKI